MDSRLIDWRLSRACKIAVLRNFCCVVVALAAGNVWTNWTDVIKARGVLGALLMTSQPSQRLHNFGTLKQRFSWALFSAICERCEQLLGVGGFQIILLLVGVRLIGKTLGLGPNNDGSSPSPRSIVDFFLLPFFLFPTLYEVHAYYAEACGVFLIFAVAMMLTEQS